MTMDPADFASLLEREPLDTSHSPSGLDALTREMLLRQKAEQALESAAARIKSLEDVLVAIRVKAAQALAYRPTSPVLDGWGASAVAALEAIDGVIGETLDPCKPWCVLAEPGRKHEGACIEDEVYDGE